MLVPEWLSRHAKSVGRWWWLIIASGFVSALSILGEVAGRSVLIPTWGWALLFLGAVVVAQLAAARDQDVRSAEAVRLLHAQVSDLQTEIQRLNDGPDLVVWGPSVDPEKLVDHTSGWVTPIQLARVRVLNRSLDGPVAQVRAWVSFDGTPIGNRIARWTSSPEPRTSQEAADLDGRFHSIAPQEEFTLDIAARFSNGSVWPYLNASYAAGFRHPNFDFGRDSMRVRVELKGPGVAAGGVFLLKADRSGLVFHEDESA